MKKLIRPLVERLHAYVPGEQPRIAGLIKLNTNENPYPPSPGVLARSRRPLTVGSGYIRTPRPRRCGSAWRNSTVRPSRTSSWETARTSSSRWRSGRSSSPPGPGAVVLAELLPLPGDCEAARRALGSAALNRTSPCLRSRIRKSRAGLSTRPSRSSRRPTRRAAAATRRTSSTPSAEPLRGVVILDEAYVDFASENALRLRSSYPHVLDFADVLERVFALLPTRGLLRRSGGAHRRARQDPRQLQRQRPGPGGRAGDAGRPALLSQQHRGRSSRRGRG